MSFPVMDASFAGPNGSAVPLEAGYLGVNIRADSNFTSSLSLDLNSTDVRTLRWPGGGLGDRFDPLGNGDQGLIYNDEGQASSPGTTFAQFVSLCRTISCKSIVTLPAEIDNASVARAIVNYSESALGFRPTYWEIGNEPSLWEHFGIPWSRWNASQTSAPTPDQYATLVQEYVTAIRSVDNSTGIIGLGGIGKGGSEVPEWFGPTVETDGPNLSAMAIHVYPAGSGFPVTDVAAWYDTLWGPTGLPERVLNAESAVHSACPGCHISILADEFQLGTGLTENDSLVGGQRATFVAAEIVEGLPLPIASLDYYDFQSGGPGAWFDSAGASSETYALYVGLAEYLGTYAAELNVTSQARGVLAAVGGMSDGSTSDLVVVNANASVGIRLNLSAQFDSAISATAWVFDGTSAGPSVAPVGSSGAAGWTLPPASLVIFRGLGSMHAEANPAFVSKGYKSTPLPGERLTGDHPQVLASLVGARPSRDPLRYRGLEN